MNPFDPQNADKFDTSSDETPATAKKDTPEGQLSLAEILDEIERDANAGLSVNPDRLDCRHNLEKLRLVKALRRLITFAQWMTHQPPVSKESQQAIIDVLQLLTEPEKEKILEE